MPKGKIINFEISVRDERCLRALEYGISFWTGFPKHRKQKAKIHKWNSIKAKNFCSAKVTINRIKKQPIIWEKIFANYISDKGL